MIRRSEGQASVEILLVVPVVLLLLLLGLEFALAYRQYALLQHATFMAARAGAMHHGCRKPMGEQLARSLAPERMRDQASYLDLMRARLQSRQDRLAWAEIEILYPPREVLEQFRQTQVLTPSQVQPCEHDDRPVLMPMRRVQVVPNSHLDHRIADRIPVPHKGAALDLSIQDANLLRIRVRYCHQLLSPVTGFLLDAIALENDSPEPRLLGLCAHGEVHPFGRDTAFLAMNATATVRMQTPCTSQSAYAKP